MAFTPRLKAPSNTNPWFIHTSAGGKNSCIKVSGNSVLPNCVGYAWGRFGEIMGSTPKLSRGDAGKWYGNTSDGYARGKTPKLGAVACWSKPGAAGHVAIVEKINSDGSIVISESGYKASSKFWTSTRTGPNWYSSPYKFQGFIYNPSVNSSGLADGGVDASNIIDDFVHLAESHVGEGGSWAYKVSGLSPGNAWCCAFVDACAKTLGLCKVIFPHTYACRYMVRDGVANYNCTYTKGAHFGNKNIIPARGDLILFRWKTYSGKKWWFAEHIGIVRKVENGKVYTVEGNSSNKVRLKEYSINYNCIAGYLRADWAKVGGYVGGYLGPLYDTRNTREDAIIREVGYISTNYEPSINSSDIELSVINYTALLSDLFDNFREKYGYMFAGGDVDVNVDGVSGNCKIVIEFFLRKGFNAAAAVGVAANIKQESGFNPAAEGDNHTSFGICQWHLGRGSNMKKFVGDDWRTDLTGQLNFLLHELETSYKTVLSAMKNAPNTLAGAKQVADVFVRKFEIPAKVDQRSKERQAIAETYWKQIVIQQKTTTTTTTKTNTSTSTSGSSSSGTGKLLGRFKLTAYCNCSKCCGKWAGGPTASGVMPKAGRTIAVDPKVIPLGSKVKINGHIYTAEDTGSAIKGEKIDIYHSSHSAALDFGVQHANVYLMS